MATLNQPQTLDDYRTQVVTHLKTCPGASAAVGLLSDIETMLAAMQNTHAQQKAFWRGLSQDLDLLAQQAMLLDPDAAATLRAVIAVARAATLRCLRVVQDQ